MDITICGHKRAVELLREAPNELDIIFISSPDNPYAVTNSHKIPALAREICEILFYDVSHSIAHMDPPEQHHVEKALEFAKGRDKLIVACQAGISRSSATAYLIKAAEVGPEEALKILNPHVHHPNGAVIRHGAKILGLPQIVEMIYTWKNKADEIQWDVGPELDQSGFVQDGEEWQGV